MEEAAKILILLDAVRCPPKLISLKLNRIIGWFYDHLAHLIYADAVSWKPTDLAQLREYVTPHWAVYERRFPSLQRVRAIVR